MKQNKISGFNKGNSEAGFNQLWWKGHFSNVAVFLHLEHSSLSGLFGLICKNMKEIRWCSDASNTLIIYIGLI